MYTEVLIVCVQNDERTALHFAAAKGNVEIFRMLLGGGADVEVTDKVRSSWILLSSHSKLLFHDRMK